MIVANRLPVDRVVACRRLLDLAPLPRRPGQRARPGDDRQRGRLDRLARRRRSRTLDLFEHDGITLVPIAISQQEYEEYYEGFSNATLWPLYHDLVAKPEFHREWWDAYVAVNRRFAEAAAEVAAEGATVWVQDYQLQLVPEPAARAAHRPADRVLPAHPVPARASCSPSCPGGGEILEGLLGADLVGFQLSGAAQNFIRLVRQRVGHKTHRDTVYLPDGRRGHRPGVPDLDRHRRLRGAGPRRPTCRSGRSRSATTSATRDKVFLGIDRLDYTKGIYARLRAFSELIHDGHFTVEDATFVQVASPSRERVDQYRMLRDEIDRLVGHINGDLGRIGRPAISYLNASFPQSEMAALYVAADIMVVTPFRDGMNLVAKEYVACRLRRRRRTGALRVRRRGRGAAPGLPGQPLRHQRHEGPDAGGVPAADRRSCARRMRAMRKTVAENDVDSLGHGVPRRRSPARGRRTTSRCGRPGGLTSGARLDAPVRRPDGVGWAGATVAP